jgi:micrococcal nuclease
VYDGDTITVNIDLGLDVYLNKQKIRLLGINAPEMRGKDKARGIKSRDWLRSKIEERIIIIRIDDKKSKGKYGRWLGVIIVDGVNINKKMVEMKLAVKYLE